MEDFKKIGPAERPSFEAPVLIEPATTIDLQSASTSRGEEGETLLVEYFRLISRHRWLIVLSAALGAIIALAICLTTRPVYRARTSLDIQNLNADFMNMRAVAPTGQVNGAGSAEVYIQTEIKLLESDALLNRTVQRMRPEAYSVAATQEASIWGRIKATLHLPGAEPPKAEAILDYTAKNIAVKPLGLTRLVEVNCDSWDARFAADFCNALVNEFQQQDREIRWAEAQKTSEWLSRQLADVREQLAASERKLQSAAETDGLLFTQGSTSVGEEKLRELQAELMKAQAERVTKQAQFEMSRSVSADSLPAVLDDVQLRDYQTKLADLRTQLTNISPPLTDAHPRVQKLKAQIKELEMTLNTKKADVVSRMANEFEASLHREKLLETAYSAQERKVAGELGRESQVNMLRREVESGQQLYTTLLQRVKEAGFASAMQASTIRIVDAATKPALPIIPRRTRLMAVGLILGTLAGICYALFKDRTETVLRVPGEAPRYLQVRELGVIPSARAGLGSSPMRRLIRPASSGLLKEKSSQDQVMDLATWRAHASLVAEAYRNTTYSILGESKGHGRGRAYVITSPSAGEGKTTVTSNLGIALSQANRRVLLIDADLRRPRLHKSMAIPNTTGLRDILRGSLNIDTLATDQFCHASQVPNLSVLSSGSGSEESSGLLYSPRLRTLLDRLVNEFDVVLIDTPPILHMADARIAAGAADGVILVLRASATDRKAALNARKMFQHDQVRVIGTILNDFDPLANGQKDYYSSYYQYQNAGAGEARRA